MKAVPYRFGTAGEGSFELSAFCTLKDPAAAVRGPVNDEILTQVVADPERRGWKGRWRCG
ncbi:hypothetical protein [Streptomyces sp. NPDC054834]